MRRRGYFFEKEKKEGSKAEAFQNHIQNRNSTPLSFEKHVWNPLLSSAYPFLMRPPRNPAGASRLSAKSSLARVQSASQLPHHQAAVPLSASGRNEPPHAHRHNDR